MGKKTKHVSEPAYWIPDPKGGAPKLKGVSKKKALQQARGQKKLDPKQRARLAGKAGKGKGAKGKGGGKGKGRK